MVERIFSTMADLRSAPPVAAVPTCPGCHSGWRGPRTVLPDRALAGDHVKEFGCRGGHPRPARPGEQHAAEAAGAPGLTRRYRPTRRFDIDPSSKGPYLSSIFRSPQIRRRRWAEDGWLGDDFAQLAVALPDGTLAGIVSWHSIQTGGPDGGCLVTAAPTGPSMLVTYWLAAAWLARQSPRSMAYHATRASLWVNSSWKIRPHFCITRRDAALSARAVLMTR